MAQMLLDFNFYSLLAGIMLILHGYNKNYPLTWSLGGLLIVGSTCGIPMGCYAVRRQRRKRKKRKEQYRKERSLRLTKAAYENDSLEQCLEV